MANIFDIEDNLWDAFQEILDPQDFNLVWANQVMPEDLSETYVTIEVDDLQQIGRAYTYPIEDDPNDSERSLQRTKTEWTSPLIFTALGPRASEALIKIARSHNVADHRYLLTSKGIAIRGQSGVKNVPSVVGASNEKGATLTLEMGISDIFTQVVDYIEKTTVFGEIATANGLHTITTIAVKPSDSEYERLYGHPIDLVLKDYHFYTGDFEHTNDLGIYGDPITNSNDSGNYP